MFHHLSLKLSLIISLIMIANSLAQGSLDQRIAELSQQISKEMSDNNKRTIAVIEFSDLDGNVTNLGKYISEELITKLYLTKKFKVIERQLLNKIIAEQKLSLAGMIDPNSAKKLGGVLGVDAIVSGTITDLSQSLKVNARILNSETGEIFAVASVEIFKDESVRVLLKSENTSNDVNRKDDNGNKKIPSNKFITTTSSAYDFTFTIKECTQTGNQIKIILLITNNGTKSIRKSIQNNSRIIDDSGNQYDVKRINIGGSDSWWSYEYLPQIPTRVILTFQDISGNPSTLSILEFIFNVGGAYEEKVYFKNLPIIK